MEKQIKCPQCKNLTVYSEQNKFRPFCSERCRLLDFGDWAQGRYAIPAQETHPENEDNPEPNQNGDDDGPV